MPEAERDRILSEAAVHAALLYEADLALVFTSTARASRAKTSD